MKSFLVDASETPIERPKKTTLFLFRQKKHTIKSLIVIAKRCHDFNLFKKSKVHVHSDAKTITDSGYQGIKNATPKQRSS